MSDLSKRFDLDALKQYRNTEVLLCTGTVPFIRFDRGLFYTTAQVAMNFDLLPYRDFVTLAKIHDLGSEEVEPGYGYEVMLTEEGVRRLADSRQWVTETSVK